MNRPSDPSVTTLGSSDETSDETILGFVADGDAAALATLYDRYSNLAYAVSLKITRDATLAQDVVQEAFLGVWRNAGRYAAGKGSVRTWVLSIAHHRAIDAIRRRRPTSELPEGDAPPAPLVIPDIWHEVSGRLDREEIRQALDTLSSPQREAIELAYYSGLTQQEIAERTATPLGTVKSRVRLGLLALRRALEKPLTSNQDGTPTGMGT